MRNLQNTRFISITTTEKLNFCRLFREVQQTLATTNPYGLENSRQPYYYDAQFEDLMRKMELGKIKDTQNMIPSKLINN